MIDIGTCTPYFCNPSMFDMSDGVEKYGYPPSVTFCLPGNNYSSGFFNSWTHLLFFLKNNPDLIIPHYVNYYSSNVYALRNAMLGGDSNGEKFQIPLIEDFDTKYIFFIDSDMTFTPMQVIQILYKMEKCNLDVLSAMYYMSDGKKLTILKDDSEDCLIENNSFDYYFLDELVSMGEKDENKLCEVDNVGLGFVCVRNSIFGKISYPWFDPEPYEKLRGFYNDDLSFFRKLKKHGYKLYCDTSLMVGHDKTITLK